MFVASVQHTNAGIMARRAASKMAEEEANARLAARNAEAVSLYRQVPVHRANSARVIAMTVAARHGMTFELVAGASRNKRIVAVRDEAIRAVADARPDMSLPAIGRVFNRDHTTILHSLRKTRAEGQPR